MKKLNSKLFEGYKVSENAIDKVKGGEASTSIFSDTNASKETGGATDVKTKWGDDSTTKTSDTVPDYD